MIFALNEIEALAKRAVRGVGFDWGIAEEAGKSVRWLAAHGLPGPELLADTLTRNEGRAYEDLVPVCADGIWRASCGLLCPLIAGTALADRAKDLASGSLYQLGATTNPLLLLPYAANSVKAGVTGIELTWPDAVISIGAGVVIEGDDKALATATAAWVQCSGVETSLSGMSVRETYRYSLDVTEYERLNDFAQRTYAPATEESRVRGAGADRG